MSFFGKNIKKIRTVKKLSQSAFAEIFKLTRASIGAYEEGRAEAKIDTIVNIAKYFRISTDALLTKELTVNEIIHFDLFKEEYLKGQQTRRKNEEFIPFVPAERYSEYLTNIEKSDFIEKLPTIKLPLKNKGIYRAFEHQGCEMHNNGLGLHHGDILVCESTDKNDWDNLEINNMYIIVSRKNILTRRLTGLGQSVQISPDNPNFNSMIISKEEIYELWKAKSFYSNVLMNHTDLDQRINKLENRVDLLQKQLLLNTQQ
jgi:transcriptional regulator with XRE-family HTH domain